MKTIHRQLSVALLISSSLTSAALAAPDSVGTNADDNSPQVTEIVVTAQKRSENLQDVPIAVTALSADVLSKRQVTDVTDLSGMVPNLQISQQGQGPGALSLSLRGIFSQEIERSFEPGVGVIADGVYLSTSNGLFMQNFDIDSIQVLRGPQGTLQGKNNTGGAIIITRTKADPSEPFRGKVKLTAGSFGRKDAEAVFTFPIVPDLLAAKVALFSQNNNGAWKNPVFDRRQGKRDYQAGTIGITFTPSPDTEINLTYDKVDDRSQLPPRIAVFSSEALPLPIPGYENGASAPCSNPFLPEIDCSGRAPSSSNVVTQDLPDNAKFLLDAVTLNARQKLGDVDVVFVGGYRNIRQDDFLDVDGTQYPLYQDRRPEDFEQLSGELRFETNFSGPFNIISGLYYFKSQYQLDNLQQLDFALASPIEPGTSILPFGYSVDHHSESIAVFADGQLNITSKLQLFGGLRQTWDRKRIEMNIYSGGTIDNFESFGPLTDSGRLKAKFDFLTLRAGLKYDFSEDLVGYTSYSRGANTGGFNGRAAATSLLGPYQPEFLDAYEVGLKAELFDRRVRLSTALFLNEFSDKQEEILVSVPVAPFTGTTVVNVAAARYKGIEVEAEIAATRGLNFNFSGSYLDAKYSDFTASLRPGFPATDNTVLELRRAPKWTASGTADYSFSVGDNEAGLNLSGRYISEFFTDALNDPRSLVPGTLKLDASARYSFDVKDVRMQASAFVKNITDRTPINSFLTSGGLGDFVAFVGQDIGRTFGISLQAEF